MERIVGLPTTMRPFRCRACGTETQIDVYERDWKDRVLVAFFGMTGLLVACLFVFSIVFD